MLPQQGGPLQVGSVDSVLPDVLHRSFLWSSQRTTFRVDLPLSSLNAPSTSQSYSPASAGEDLLVTLVSGAHDFAVEPMEFLQSHPAGNFVGFSTTALAVSLSQVGGSHGGAVRHGPNLFLKKSRGVPSYCVWLCVCAWHVSWLWLKLALLGWTPVRSDSLTARL